MKALVTGCAGFIGSNLVDKLLESGHEVIGIDCYTDYYPKSIKERNISEAVKNHSFKLIQEDILNMCEFPEVDYVFHLAAQAGVRASWGKSFDIYTKNNIEATQRILEFYKERSIKKLVYASSSSVYGDVQLPMREDSPLRPLSPYGVTKLAGENLCYLYWKNYDIPTISLRYFTVYGPRQRPDMAIHKFVNAILNKKEITIYDDGAQMRDFTYVSDVVCANIAAAEKNIVGRVFNIGGSSEISVNMLIKKISHMIGMDAIVRHEEKQKGDARFTKADVSSAKENLNWTPKVDLDNGLTKYLDWIKKTL
jgi:UDP-glucose 4-epimerase